MEILACIKDLLIQNDCVTIPGFGGFATTYHPADIQASMFIPPTKVVSFNRKLNFNDGLLIGWIARKEAVSYRDASTKVSQLVAEINFRLTEGEPVNFPGIGIIEYDINENLVFSPQVFNEINPDVFGLFAFSHEKYIHPTFVDKVLHIPPVLNNRKLQKALVGIPLLLLLSITPVTNQKSFQKSDISTFHELPVYKNSIVFTTPELSIDISENEFIGLDLKENKIPTPVIPGIKTAEKKHEYYLIVGSFKLKEGAERQVNILTRKGYKPQLLKVNGSNYVAAESYSTRENAATGLRKYNSRDAYSGAWIYKNK